MAIKSFAVTVFGGFFLLSCAQQTRPLEDLPAITAVSPVPNHASQQQVRPTTMGPVCWAAILEAISHVGERCVTSEDPAFRSELDRSTQLMRDLLVQRGGWSAEQLQAFRVQMAELDDPDEILCSNPDSVEFYRHLATAGASQIAATTAEVISRPGPVEWGDCL